MLRIVLVHAGDIILPELGESLGRYAQKQLGRRGVEIRLKTAVAGYDGKELKLNDGTKRIQMAEPWAQVWRGSAKRSGSLTVGAASSQQWPSRK